MRSLRAITIVYSIAFAVALLSASAILYLFSARSLVRELDTRLSTEASDVVSGGGDLATIASRLRRHEALRANADLSYMLADRHGRPLAGQLKMRLPAPGFSNIDYTDGIEGIDHGRALTTMLADGAALLLVADDGPIEDFNARAFQLGSLVLAVMIALGWRGGLAFSRAISRRIDATTRIAESVMRGELDRRMPFDGTDDVFDRQALVFNAMLDRIELLMANLQQISSDVAHDLRTPLMRLRHQAARLAATAPTRIEPGELEGVVAQSDQLLALFGAILRIAEVDAGSRRAYFTAIDLDALARELVATFSLSIEADGGRLETGAIEPLVIGGDRELLSQALINLLDNAAKYAGPGATVMLSVTQRDGVAQIMVRDDGPGIAATARETALRRFGRLDGSRSRPGNGLGLSLVASVARLHGGCLMLDDAEPGLAAILAVPIGWSPTGRE